MVDAPRYRFGPLEKRGVLAGLRLQQLITLAVGGVLIVLSIRMLPTTAALVSLLLVGLTSASFAFVPIGRRTLDEWLPIVTRWSFQGILGQKRFVSPAPLVGATTHLEPQPRFPSVLRNVTILSHTVAGADSIGVLKDGREGTFTAVLSVRGRSFALLDGPEKARRLAGWASILAGFAREGGPVHRLQWIERTVPDAGDEVGNYLKENLAVPLDSLIARSYLEVVDEAGPVTQQHETLIALQIHAGRSARAIKAAGGGDAAACEILRRELTNLVTRLMGADVTVEGVLTPRLVARCIRSAFDPTSRVGLAQLAARSPVRDGTSITNAGPMAAEAHWSTYRTDDCWHRTYWIAEWPRVEADPDFLAPLLLRTECMRSVSLTMEPVDPIKAMRSVESARTSAAADEELRNRAGFMPTARRTREQDSLASHERELGDGHAFYRFAGFVTVTASDPDQLERDCADVEEAAGRCFLDIRRLSGQQDAAFTYTLPLCRGLR